MFPAALAVLAGLGYRLPQRPNTVGIDLGTTFSVVAYKDPNTKQVHVVPNTGDAEAGSQSRVGYLTPSVVSFFRNGSSVAGAAALPFLTSQEADTIFNAKRFIGRSASDVADDASLADIPHVVAPNDQEGPRDDPAAAFLIFSNSPEQRLVSPVEVGARVVKQLMSTVDSFLGHGVARKAVIAVPAEFHDVSTKATLLAFKQAGLKVVRVLEEPTAAAIAYGLNNDPHVHYVLVYDFGGGTLDISLLWINIGSVQVLSTDGDLSLGGTDFDSCIASYLQKKNSWSQQCSAAELRVVSESLKRQLSDAEQGFAECAGHPISLSRQQFHETCEHLFKRAILPVQRILTTSNLAPSDIDEIVLVGGSTRIPHVKQQIRNMFPGTNVNDKIDPDLAVAYGAAMVVD